jgi:hypothetical protein
MKTIQKIIYKFYLIEIIKMMKININRNNRLSRKKYKKVNLTINSNLKMKKKVYKLNKFNTLINKD